MSSFTTPLIVEPLEDGRHWKLVEKFEFNNKKYTISVPAGFITDFASVPRIFWWLIPPTGRYGKAAVVHDFCYRKACFSRKECDWIFLEGMRALGVPKWKRLIMWAAVRLFGWSAYAKPNNTG